MNLWMPFKKVTLQTEVPLNTLQKRIIDNLILMDEQKGKSSLLGNSSRYELELDGNKFSVVHKTAKRDSIDLHKTTPFSGLLEETERSTMIHLKFSMGAFQFVFMIIAFCWLVFGLVGPLPAIPGLRDLLVPGMLIAYFFVGYRNSVSMRKKVLRRIIEMAEIDILESEDTTVLKKNK